MFPVGLAELILDGSSLLDVCCADRMLSESIFELGAVLSTSALDSSSSMLGSTTIGISISDPSSYSFNLASLFLSLYLFFFNFLFSFFVNAYPSTTLTFSNSGTLSLFSFNIYSFVFSFSAKSLSFLSFSQGAIDSYGVCPSPALNLLLYGRVILIFLICSLIRLVAVSVAFACEFVFRSVPDSLIPFSSSSVRLRITFSGLRSVWIRLHILCR